MSDMQSGLTDESPDKPDTPEPHKTHPASTGDQADVNVEPADLVAVSDRYGSLAAQLAGLPAQAADQITQVAQTHGPMGYSTAFGMCKGLGKAETRLLAKSRDFTQYQQRFLEHANTYATTDHHNATTQTNTTTNL
ncbi:type VII secretion target [Mycobacteroides abscessus]|uniref:type VII secretion target n=1 Tax=Mycobacteroides abscessus TaxID=36809 RepID=UPI0009D5A5BD|nr:type VII secretion target [Mycobacteroides abscessus]SKT95078.1 Protein of uncharacterised function (DUF2580) [Mycobacteroides abscessus subsp. massiliense]SKU12914.1 Protein of uncharacterised function (DUF2580) [Mycobacteroides abscessus subsp. massiliense]